MSLFPSFILPLLPLLHSNKCVSQTATHGEITLCYTSWLYLSPQSLSNSTFYVDCPENLSPSLITGDKLRPGILISNSCDTLYFIEIRVVFATNLSYNARQTPAKHHNILIDPSFTRHHAITFILSICPSGIFGQSCASFIQMCSDQATNQTRPLSPNQLTRPHLCVHLQMVSTQEWL